MSTSENTAGNPSQCAIAGPSNQSQASMQAPRTDVQIRAVTIGDLRPLVAPVQIADYDSQWPDLFECASTRIQTVLGNRVLLIEHVGSTSVPGLAAKPILDVVLVVADSANEPAYVRDLENAGYVLRIREKDWFEHRMFKGSDPDTNLHVFSWGCPEIDRMLRFRNWLRMNTPDRQLYERAKRELAGRDWKYMQNYADAKSAVVTEILTRALGDARGGMHEER